MKTALTLLSFLLCFQAWSQLDFKEVKKHLEGSKTDFKTVSIGDINNDGRKDLVVGSGFYFDATFDYSIIIYKQNADGNLMAPIHFRYPTSYPGLKVLQIADLNNDHLNDIAIGYSDSIGIFYQLKDGQFGKITSFYSGGDVDGLKTGDLNNDGITDIAVSHWNSPYISIFTQNAEGELSRKTHPVKSAGYDEIDIGDMNGDHLNDVIFMPGQGRQSTLQILYQVPLLGITDAVYLYRNTDDYYTTFTGIGIGDLNNDGKSDLVGAKGSNGESLLLMYQDDQGKIDQNIVKIPAHFTTTAVEIADLNCDGDNEIIVGGTTVSIFEKDSTRKYAGYKQFHTSYNYNPYGMAVGDLNNDNRLDIVSVDSYTNISILYNTSKPKVFSKIETKIINLKMRKDTTSSTRLITEAIIDPSPTCKVNRELKQQITTRYANEYITGDSLIIRTASLCNSNHTDTITHPVNYTRTKVISNDTVKTIVNTDLLTTFYTGSRLGSSINSSEMFSLNANICWTLHIDQNWLFSSKSSGSGSEPILLVATENHSTSSRSAVVTITGKDVPTVTIQVIQDGALPFLSTSASSVILSENAYNTAYFTISSNINWEIVNPLEWVSLDKYKGSNNALITLSALPNTSSADRSGIVFIKGDNNLIQSMAVTQLFAKTDVINVLEEGEVTVYPNPFKDKVYLGMAASSQEVTLEVFDSTGRKIMSRKLEDKMTEIDMTRFPKGLYSVKVITNKNTVTRKIIKQ